MKIHIQINDNWYLSDYGNAPGGTQLEWSRNKGSAIVFDTAKQIVFTRIKEATAIGQIVVHLAQGATVRLVEVMEVGK